MSGGSNFMGHAVKKYAYPFKRPTTPLSLKKKSAKKCISIGSTITIFVLNIRNKRHTKLVKVFLSNVMVNCKAF